MEKPTCADCIYYINHYRKGNNRFHLLECGHCMNVKLNGHKRIADKLCECFKEKDLEKERENQIKSATEYLFIISERINELTEILKETQTVDK